MNMSHGGVARVKSAGLLIALLPVLAACAGKAPSAPSPTQAFYGGTYYEVAMTQCLINKHAIPDKDIQGQSWYRNGKVSPNADFAAWVGEHRAVKDGKPIYVYAGKPYDDWMNAAEEKWPVKFCRPSPSPDV